MQTTVVGSYPKPPHEGGEFTVRRLLHAVDKDERWKEQLSAAQDDLAEGVIREQLTSGIDLVTDGHVRWDDILTPFASRMHGFEIGGLIRWFDNNVYYRRPICTGEIEWTQPASVRDFEFAKELAGAERVKAVVPGPSTFARMSIDDHYGDHEAFVRAIGDAIASEISALVSAGARHIQIDEPALLFHPEDVKLLQGSPVFHAGVEITLATYFGHPARVPGLFDLPVECVAVDLCSAGSEVPEAPDGMILQVGVVDGRNTRLEEEETLVRTASQLARRFGQIRLAPSCGLEFLPRGAARAKLELLARVSHRMGE